MRATDLAFVLLACAVPAVHAQPGTEATPPNEGMSIGYELLEMAMNGFQYFAGEVGYAFDDRHRLRLTAMEVKLTERHLSSEYEAAAIDGEGVTGYLRAYELHYQRRMWRGLYLSGAIGYTRDRYKHEESGDELINHTPTVGLGVGYRWKNPLSVPHLYVDLAVPVRYYINPIDETQLGDATVRPHVVVNNIWLFIGGTWGRS
jgi:hypothetical protein